MHSCIAVLQCRNDVVDLEGVKAEFFSAAIFTDLSAVNAVVKRLVLQLFCAWNSLV